MFYRVVIQNKSVNYKNLIKIMTKLKDAAAKLASRSLQEQNLVVVLLVTSKLVCRKIYKPLKC